MSDPTEAQVDAAYAVLRQEIVMPYEADVHDYIVSEDEPSGEEREEALAKLRAADEDAERKNRDLVRRAVKAALEAE